MSEQQLLGSGADGQFLADFRALAEATSATGDAKYSARVLQGLALFLVGQGGGGHRDTPLFELCHLVNIVAGAGNDVDGGDLGDRWQFFLGQEQVTAAGCRQQLQTLQARSGWRHGGFAWAENGALANYGDDAFTVTFGRMPFLLALFEFLASMDAFVFHQELNDILDDMVAKGDNLRAIQDGANRIASAMRQYRGAHLEQGMHDDAFMAILNYLRQEADAGAGGQDLSFHDDDILEFWRRHNDGDFRTYRKAFTRFADFTAAMATTQARRHGESAAPLGGARDLGEEEPDDLRHSSAGLDDLAVWTDPLELLDSGPAAEIKFFTQAGERDPLAPLALFGPFARRLPLAFLRYLAFGTVQAAITTALQFHPGRRVEARLLSCDGAETYAARRQLYEKLRQHLERLHNAAFHALTQAGHQAALENDDGVALLTAMTPERLFEAARREVEHAPDPSAEQIAALREEAAAVFRKLSRRGFEAEALDDEDRQEGFRVGAGVLSALGEVLDGYLGGLGRLDQDAGLEALFTADRAVFAREFGKLYGVGNDRDQNAG
ncbi:MAG: hypothetical protein QF512_02845 [Alphaproteobacteria bacterium]|nr:hypothetical protein [Alphaproteobacteria bacterium]